MGFGVRVDGSTDLGDPEFGAVVDEQREDQAELVAVEGPVWLADDDGVEAAVGCLQRGQERVGLGAPFPGQ